MICLRCGYCCVHYAVIIVDDPKLGIEPGNLKEKCTGDRCPHLTGDVCGEYGCAIHDKPWYDETPCYEFGQIENSPTDPCRMGVHITKNEEQAMSEKKKRGWVFTDDDTDEEIGFAEPDEYRDADDAVDRFGRNWGGNDFSIYFRDSNGDLCACGDDSRPEDFD